MPRQQIRHARSGKVRRHSRFKPDRTLLPGSFHYEPGPSRLQQLRYFLIILAAVAFVCFLAGSIAGRLVLNALNWMEM